MKLILTLMLAAALSACVTHPAAVRAPAFTAPNSAPVGESVRNARNNIIHASEQAEMTKAEITAARAAVDSGDTGAVTLHLEQAAGDLDLLSAQLVEAKSNTLQATARIALLDTKISEQTFTLNSFAEQNNKLLSDNAALQTDRDRWRKIAVHWRLIAAGVACALTLYVLRGPIFALARHAIGIPI